MNRRSFLKKAVYGGLAAGLASCAKPQKQLNIVLIMADDLGYECIGANGGESYQTPHIDSLAQTGIRFNHCYAQPLCTPSRVQIMTGMYNVRNYVKFGVLDKNQTTFAHLFKNTGYQTCVVGKWQLGGGFTGPNHFGFDEYCLWQLTGGRTDKNGHDSRYPNPLLDKNGERINLTSGEYGPDVVTDFACTFIEKNHDKPFLLYYPMILTHCPFVPTPDSEEWNPDDPGSLDYKGDARYFGVMVSYMDKLVGKITAKLDELGIRENTLLLFTGDNGTDTPVVSKLNGKEIAGAKGQTTDAGTHVPLVAYWPSKIKPQVCDDLVDFSDFLPTMCESATIPLPQELKPDGHSFWPQLLGKKGNPREWVYCWYSRTGEQKEARVFARTKRYKLYHTGEFYDVAADQLEQNPIPFNSLSVEVQHIWKKLDDVILKFGEKILN